MLSLKEGKDLVERTYSAEESIGEYKNLNIFITTERRPHFKGKKKGMQGGDHTNRVGRVFIRLGGGG